MKRGYILFVLLALLIYQSLISAQCFAFETRRVVLVGPVDTARYQSQEITKIIDDSWKRVFRYPFYEVTAEIRSIGKPVDKAVLEQLARENDADIIVATEIACLHDITYGGGFFDEETWQEIDLQLAVKTYVKSGGQYKTYSVRRWQREPLSVTSGAVPLVSDAMEEVLAKSSFKRVPQDIR